MARTTYCWRCKLDIPMLDESEWAEIEPVLFDRPDEALEHYHRLTGFRETNANAIWHHRLALLGPPCNACGRPLRTPRAKICACCGERQSGQQIDE